MKVQYCSDLHLEFKENHEFLKRNPIKAEGEIMVLAGDIMPFAIMDRFNDFLDYLSDSFEAVYWIPGNHEYYYDDIDKRVSAFTEKIRKNVFLINNKQIECKGVNFIFSTLWSHISPQNQWRLSQSVSDFMVIKDNGGKLSPDKFNLLHKESVAFLRSAIENNKGGKSIIVTHHVPTLMHYPEKYKNSPINEAFAVELYDLIENCGADFWIYGHHHINIPVFRIGETQLVTNQLGYVQNNEQAGFRNDKVIEIQYDKVDFAQ